MRQKEHPVYRRDKKKSKPEKPWLLEYKWTDAAHPARYTHEKLGNWYYGPLKITHLSAEHAVKEINKNLRSGNQRLNDLLYGGRLWRVRELTSGETIGIIFLDGAAAASD
jgi:hypothetical protein